MAVTDGSAVAEEPALERLQQLVADERLRVDVAPVLLEDADVVLERRVRRIERVLQLVALEDVVVPPRLGARPMVRIDRSSDGPDRSGLALDPDDDALVAAFVVDSCENAFGEAAFRLLPLHEGKDTIAAMQRLASLLRSPFSFLFSGTSAEDRVAAYVIREHSRGRGLAEILQDRYVQNRLDPQQQRRLLDRPEVVHALGDEAVEATRRELASLSQR
jgi:hypothetical protein